MWFKLDLDGIIFLFRILQYKPSTKENWDEEWCRVDLHLQAGDWLNYRLVSNEILLSSEVEDLRDGIDALLHDRLGKPEELECIEPDLVFHFNPKMDARDNPRVLYVKPGNEIVDIDMEMIISFWNGGLTANRMVLGFDRSDMEKLLCYLRYVTGSLSKDSSDVAKLVVEGTLYE